MKFNIRPHLRKLLILPPVAVGIVVLVWFARNRREPQRVPEQEETRVLRVIAVPQVAVVPRALGYGTAEAGRVWQAISEVKGRVVEVHPDLKPGAIIKKGDVVLRIDKAEYQLSVDRLTEEIRQAEAQRDELTAKTTNYEEQRKLEEKSLRIANVELTRLEEARKRGAVNASEVDAQKRTVLTQELKVRSVVNSQKLLPAQQKSTAALVAAKRKNLQQAQLDLKKTTLTAPFDCRIGPVSIEVSQFLAAGQKLYDASAIDIVEIEAQVALHRLRDLIGGSDRKTLPKSIDMKAMREIFKIEARVRFHSGAFQAEWPADFARIRETLDQKTRMLGVVVAIKDPYSRAIPGVRPPIVPGTFCEVEFRGVLRPNQVVIPRSAIREDHVYVVNGKNRLERRRVDIELVQGNFAVIADGLQPGEKLVVSDPTPAIEGMLVKPVPDDSLRERILKEARGEGDLR